MFALRGTTMTQMSFGVSKPAPFQFDSNGSSVARSYVISEVTGAVGAAAANDASVAEVAARISRPVDPMLLVYEERLESIRQLVRWLADVFGSAKK
jgi:hypothetical protein